MATTPTTNLTRDEFADRVARLIGARVASNMEELGGFLDPNVSLTIIGDPLSIYPFPNRRFGREAVLELIISLQSTFSYRNIEIMDMIIDGDSVVVMRRARLVHRGTGRSRLVHLNDWLRFRNGLVVEIIQLNDNQALREAFGND